MHYTARLADCFDRAGSVFSAAAGRESSVALAILAARNSRVFLRRRGLGCSQRAPHSVPALFPTVGGSSNSGRQ